MFQSPIQFLRQIFAEAPMSLADQQAFTKMATTFTARAIAGLAIVVIIGVVAWWPLDHIVFAGQPAAVVRVWSYWRLAMLGAMLATAIGLALCLRWGKSPWPVLLGTTGFSPALWAWILSYTGSPDDPWIHSVNLLAANTALYVLPLWRRLGIALLMMGSLAASYFAFNPDYLASPHTPFFLSIMAFAATASWLSGHLIYLILRRDFMRGRVIENLNNTLEQQVVEQTESLFRLAAGVQQTREQDRAEIARNVHDDLGQYLTALRIQIDWLRSHRNQDPAKIDAFAQSAGQIVEGLNKSQRAIIERLKPFDERLGLGDALEALAASWARDHRIAVDTAITPQARQVSSEAAAAIFRVAVEALTNVAKHARAAHVWLELAITEAGETLLRVRDDGVGMANNQKQGFGLLGMQARARSLGARLTVLAESGQGTTIQLLVPRQP